MIAILTIGLFLAVIEVVVVCVLLPVGIALLIALLPPVAAVVAALLLINWLYGKEGKKR